MIMHVNKACTTPSHNMGKKWFYDLQLSTEIFMKKSSDYDLGNFQNMGSAKLMYKFQKDYVKKGLHLPPLTPPFPLS